MLEVLSGFWTPGWTRKYQSALPPRVHTSESDEHTSPRYRSISLTALRSYFRIEPCSVCPSCSPQDWIKSFQWSVHPIATGEPRCPKRFDSIESAVRKY